MENSSEDVVERRPSWHYFLAAFVLFEVLHAISLIQTGQPKAIGTLMKHMPQNEAIIQFWTGMTFHMAINLCIVVASILQIFMPFLLVIKGCVTALQELWDCF